MSRQLSEIKILLLKLCWTVSTFLWISIHIEGCPFRSEDTPELAGEVLQGDDLPTSSLWGWPQLKKTTMFWLHLPTEAFPFWCPKVQSHPNWDNADADIALHGIHRTGQGLDHHSTSLYPLLLFPLHFHRCWPEKLPSWTSWLLHIISGSASRQAPCDKKKN